MWSAERVPADAGRSGARNIEVPGSDDIRGGAGAAEIRCIQESGVGCVLTGVSQIPYRARRCNRACTCYGGHGLQTAGYRRPWKSRICCQNTAKLPSAEDRSQKALVTRKDGKIPQPIQGEPVPGIVVRRTLLGVQVGGVSLVGSR